MYRVVIKRINNRGSMLVEPGPWHVSQADAEQWAEILENCGYHTEVEAQRGTASSDGDNDLLRNALSSMA